MPATPRTPAPYTEADLALIKRIIPHRYPFLLVDKVRDIVPDNPPSASRTSPATSRISRAISPDVPIMPGVTIIEAMAQTAACWSASRST